jgi:hypothetical protein
MIRSLFSAFGLLVRVLLALILIARLVIVAFAGYKGSQPMPEAEANGMTDWQFVRERIGSNRELPVLASKCLSPLYRSQRRSMWSLQVRSPRVGWVI